MAVKKKSSLKIKTTSKDIENVIYRGGKISEEDKKPDRSVHVFNLRIPAKLLDKIDKAREDRDIAISRHQWILEAISNFL